MGTSTGSGAETYSSVSASVRESRSATDAGASLSIGTDVNVFTLIIGPLLTTSAGGTSRLRVIAFRVCSNSLTIGFLVGSQRSKSFSPDWATLPSSSMPRSRTGNTSALSVIAPFIAAIIKFSSAPAINTAGSTLTIRPAPLIECAARINGSIFRAFPRSSRSAASPTRNASPCVRTSSQKSSNSERSLKPVRLLPLM